MTLNDYCKVISETEKSVKCVMVGIKIENDNGGGNGRSYPVIETETSKPFILRKKGDCFRGSYPYCGDSKRLDTFFEYKGQGNYYNSWD